MNLTHLQELKRRLQNEKKLDRVWSYFLDHFGENDEFLAGGQRVNHAMLEPILEQVAQNMFVKEGAVTDMILVRIPGHGFIHGTFQMGRCFGGVLFFEEGQIGLATATMMSPPESRFARFTARLSPDQGKPSAN